jgi:hypothetical protein
MPEPPNDPDRLSLDIHDLDGGRVGTLIVGHGDRWVFWEVKNGKGVVLQNQQEQREPMSLRPEMTVLLKFLLATADGPLSVFHDSVTVWALLNRKALAKALGEL